jgi:hypothetical protein
VSAALTAVLFLLVLLLVTGWSLSPLAAAGVVTVLPVVALAGARIPGPAQARAAAGAVLLAAGVLALAFVPGDAVGWAIVAQLPAGLGMGLALPALGAPPLWRAGAVGALAVRHAGITLALLVLAPVTSAQIDDAVDITRQRGVALVLDARLDPLGKLALANASLDALDPVDPRGDLERTLAGEARRFSGDRDREAYAELTRRADEALVEGLDQAFKPALLITGGLALVAALVIWPFGPLPGRARVATGAALLALALPVGLALVRPQLAPEPVTLADPCRPRELPGIGGLRGVLQDAALRALDGAACRFGSSREELAIALADEDAARAYEREHGVDPRSAGSLLAALLGG